MDSEAVVMARQYDPEAVLTACADALVSSSAVTSQGDGGLDALVHVQLRRRPEPPTGSAFTVCDTAFAYSEVTWDEPGLDLAAAEQLDRVLVALEPLASGHYANETDLVRHPHLLARCFVPAALERLRDVAHRYDSTGLFAGPAGTTWP